MDDASAAPLPRLDRRHRWHHEEDPRDRDCLLAVCRVCGARCWIRRLSAPELCALIHRLRVERPKLLLSIARRLGVPGVHVH